MTLAGAADVVVGEGGAAFFDDTYDDLLKGIDDLAKFRIVVHLLQNPWFVADAETYAAALGFHSISSTRTRLEELKDAGVLAAREAPGGTTLYSLTPEPTLRRQLRQSCLTVPGSPRHERLLRRLALRSMTRAKCEAERRLQVG